MPAAKGSARTPLGATVRHEHGTDQLKLVLKIKIVKGFLPSDFLTPCVASQVVLPKAE
jgi:hypothetical protein